MPRCARRRPRWADRFFLPRRSRRKRSCSRRQGNVTGQRSPPAVRAVKGAPPDQRRRTGSSARPARLGPSNTPHMRNRRYGIRRASVPVTLSGCGWSAAVVRDPPICVMVRFSPSALREPVHVHGSGVWAASGLFTTFSQLSIGLAA